MIQIRKMKGILFFFTGILIISSCKNKKIIDDPTIQLKVEMLETDRAFAGMSEQKGIKQAYLEYIDSKEFYCAPARSLY